MLNKEFQNLKEQWSNCGFANPLIDEAFFDLFQNEKNSPFLKMLINAIFSSLGMDLINEIKIENAQLGQETQLSKEAILDILCSTEQNQWIDIEMQTTTPYWLSSRISLYVSRLFSAQFKKGATYLSSKPVFSIWLTPYAVNAKRNDPAVRRYRFYDDINHLCLFDPFPPKVNIIIVEINKILDSMKELAIWRSFFMEPNHHNNILKARPDFKQMYDELQRFVTDPMKLHRYERRFYDLLQVSEMEDSLEIEKREKDAAISREKSALLREEAALKEKEEERKQKEEERKQKDEERKQKDEERRLKELAINEKNKLDLRIAELEALLNKK